MRALFTEFDSPGLYLWLPISTVSLTEIVTTVSMVYRWNSYVQLSILCFEGFEMEEERMEERSKIFPIGTNLHASRVRECHT